MAEILSGAEVVDAISARLKKKTDALKAKGVAPTLAIVRLGENADDMAYERGAMARCEASGVSVKNIVLPLSCSQQKLISVIAEINADDSIHGCLLLRPLPPHIDERAVCERLKNEKDVDCITISSLGAVFTESGEGYPPCTAEACVEILEHYGIELEGKLCVVIGRSLVVGRPVSMMLQAKNATVIMCHSKTENLKELCKNADIIVSAVGRAGFLDADYIGENQTIVDIGINRGADGKLCGDADFENILPLVKAITPVPGGVGKVTSTVLVKHLVKAAEIAADKL